VDLYRTFWTSLFVFYDIVFGLVQKK